MAAYLKLTPTQALWAAYQQPFVPDTGAGPAPHTPPITPIRGPVTVAGYEGQIKLTGVHLSLTVPVKKELASFSEPTAGPFLVDWVEFSGGPPTLDPIVVTKRTDRSSVSLYEAATLAIPLIAQITLTTGDQADQTPYYTIFLDQARISQAESVWDDGQGFPVERWTFHYEQIEWKFQPFVEGEPPHRHNWDLRRTDRGGTLDTAAYGIVDSAE